MKPRIAILVLLGVGISLAAVAGWQYWATAASPRLDTPETRRQLMAAIYNNDVAELDTLLSQGVAPHFYLEDGSVPLAWAIEQQDATMTALLLDAGAAANTQDDANPFNPLFLACQYGDEAILNALLDAGANPHVVGAEGIPAFSLCAGNAPTRIVARMLAAGVPPDRADAKGQTPMMWAAAHSRIDTLNQLIDAGAEINATTASGFTPLFFAIKAGTLEAPLALIERGANPHYEMPDGTSAVELAMYQGNYAYATYAIHQGADLTSHDRNGDQLLHAAARANQPELVALLLAKGADVNSLTGESEVTWRYESNFTAATLYVPPKTPLYLATEAAAVEVMKILVDAGADLEFVPDDGNHLIFSAVVSRSMDTLVYALELFPYPQRENNNGGTPIGPANYYFAGPQLADAKALLSGENLPSQQRVDVDPTDTPTANTTTHFAADWISREVSGTDAGEQVRVRQQNFKSMGTALRSIRTPLRADSPDLSAMQVHAQTLAQHSLELLNWFPTGSGPTQVMDTDALAYIWENPERFASLAETLQNDTHTLVQQLSAETPVADSVRSLANQINATCNSCHESFRAY